MTYTVLNRHGQVQCEGETLSQAAQTILDYDGYVWEIRKSKEFGFRLFHSDFSRNSCCYDGLKPTMTFADTKEGVFRKVLKHAEHFSGMTAMTDEEYASMMSEAGQ